VGFIIEAVRALFDGHVELAVTAAAHAVDNARADGDAALLAWTLAYQSLMESYGDTISASALAHAEDALTAGQRTGSTIAQLFPLAALATVEQTDNPTRTLEAADRLARIDTTRRRFHSKISQSIAIWVRCRRGELIEGLLEWQELFRDYHHDGERFMLSTQLSGLANVLAPTHPATAADLAAIAESDAIAPIAAFSVQPYLVELGDDQHDAVAEAHERARSMSYDDAIEFALAAVERVVAKLERDTPARWLE